MKTKSYNFRFSNDSMMKHLAFIIPLLAEGKKVAVVANKEDRAKLQIHLDHHRIQSKNLIVTPMPRCIKTAVNTGRGISLGGVLIFDNGNKVIMDTLTQTIGAAGSSDILVIKKSELTELCEV